MHVITRSGFECRTRPRRRQSASITTLSPPELSFFFPMSAVSHPEFRTVIFSVRLSYHGGLIFVGFRHWSWQSTGPVTVRLLRRFADFTGRLPIIAWPGAVRRLTMRHVIDDNVRVPGALLHYRLRGSGPLLLLMQGGGGDCSGTDSIAVHLEGRHTVLTYGRR